MRIRVALPGPAPGADQPGALAVMTEQAEWILTDHRRDGDGMCAGCREWWGRLAPYPCRQAEWAATVIGHELTRRFLMAGMAR